MNDRPPPPPPPGTYSLENSLNLMRAMHKAREEATAYYRWRNIPRRLARWLLWR